MSLGNRKLGRNLSGKNIVTVKYERWYFRLLGRIACAFKGHIKADISGENYCVSCWRKIGAEKE